MLKKSKSRIMDDNALKENEQNKQNLDKHIRKIQKIERKLAINDILEAFIGLLGVLFALIENDLFYQEIAGDNISIPANYYDTPESQS